MRASTEGALVFAELHKLNRAPVSRVSIRKVVVARVSHFSATTRDSVARVLQLPNAL
jgi:hypothetical protein